MRHFLLLRKKVYLPLRRSELRRQNQNGGVVCLLFFENDYNAIKMHEVPRDVDLGQFFIIALWWPPSRLASS